MVNYSALFFAGCSIQEPENDADTIQENKSRYQETTETIEAPNPELKKLVLQEQKNFQQSKGEIVFEIQENTTLENPEKILVNVILKNPDNQPIQSIQAWFLYPVSIIKGEKITLKQKEVFSVMAPGEQNFDEEQGIVKLGSSVKGEAKKTASETILAQVEFSKTSETPFQLENFKTKTKIMILTKNGLRNIAE